MNCSRLARILSEIPDYLMTTPDTWNGKQIAAFQTYWDNLMSGNMRARAGGVRFVPGGLKEIAIKNYAFSLEQWEWLARVICAAFSVTPWSAIQQALGCSSAYIARWQGRFAHQRLASLFARHQGRPVSKRTPRLEARILAWTRRPPDDGSTHWSSRKLARAPQSYDGRAGLAARRP
jgi:hypothetical protein